MIISRASRLGMRGERVVTIVGRDAMDANAFARRAAHRRTAKSCGPGAPVAGAKSRGSTTRATTETKKPGLSGVSTR
jgi:hypothetical protein